MNRTRWVRIGGIAAGLITLGIVVFLPSPDDVRPQSSPAEAAPASSTRASSSGFTSTLASLARAVQGLGERLGALEARQARADEATAAASSAAERASDEGQEQLEQQKAEYLRRFQTVDRSFADEEPDQKWAGEMEARLGKVFTAGKFEGTRLLSTSCKASFCRMEAEHETTDNGLDFERIRRDVPGNFYLQHFDATDSGKARTVVFFVREGHREKNALYDVMYVHD